MTLKIEIIHPKHPSVGVNTVEEKKASLKKSLVEVEQGILHQPVELIYFIGSAGQVIKKEKGKEDHCAFKMLCSTAEEISGRGNVIITHNHPDSDKPVTPTLSSLDIYTATMSNVQEIRAVSEGTGNVYSLKKPKSGWPEIENQYDFQKIVECYHTVINAQYFSRLSQEERADAVAAQLYNELGYDIITLKIGELNEN